MGAPTSRLLQFMQDAQRTWRPTSDQHCPSELTNALSCESHNHHGMTHRVFVQHHSTPTFGTFETLLMHSLTRLFPFVSSLWHWSPWLWAEVSHITNSPSAPRTGILRCGKLHEVGRFGVFRKHCIRVSKLAHTCVHPQTAQVAHLLKMCMSNY